MSVQVLLITPPFTQLNTPYPATAYIKGFLNTRSISSYQVDLGIDVFLAIFSKEGLHALFNEKQPSPEWSENAGRMYRLREAYIGSIDAVIAFLQGKQPTLADRIVQRQWLPEAGRFQQVDLVLEEFGSMGLQDLAKHLATLYIEDIADYIQEVIDPHFGLSRYAEQLGRSARHFDELHTQLQGDAGIVDQIMLQLLAEYIHLHQPKLVCFSVPFPGNLYSAFKAAQWIRAHHPAIHIALGGGFPNTELRSLNDVRVMDYFHFISLDRGEAPLLQIIRFLQGEIEVNALLRTYVMQDGKLNYIGHGACNDIASEETGTPDYSQLKIDRYVSVIEVANRMHRLWSDGFWMKLTMAHGCYWAKCTFCDVRLPYIADYEPMAAQLLCDRMETMMAQTGRNGFHFVDEAAPPMLMKALALEIIQRKLTVSWWANIRFEKRFSRDLCKLLHQSGCIAVSGGLEVASNRLLELIQKGVSVEQVARVTRNFTEAGIQVHAYLMYAYPTQTVQETVDSLEMVRQLFAAGVLQSAFWHRFALTVHSPIAEKPKEYQIQIHEKESGPFANNDLTYNEQKPIDHDRFSFGLRKSLFNYMQGQCLDRPLQEWFDFSIPNTRVAPNFIASCLNEETLANHPPHAQVFYGGPIPDITTETQTKKGRQRVVMVFTFETKRKTLRVNIPDDRGAWFYEKLKQWQIKPETMQAIERDYEAQGWDDFHIFWYNKPVSNLSEVGLWVL
ncbi:MAG: radical SAM protein [Chitinophagaceae bacterium]|nr:radical SAM protein [Chitinophagaceae bacterium]